MKKYFIIVSSLLFMGILMMSGGLQSHVSAHTADGPLKEIKPSANETHHLEVKPESLEGYRIPYMKATITIVDQDSQRTRNIELHPMFGGNFHYGVNVALEPKKYLLRFHLDPPTFMRGHARENQWLAPIEAEFVFDAAVSFEKSVKIGSKETSDIKVSFEAEHAEEMFVLAEAEKEHLEHAAAVPEKQGLSHQFQELSPLEHLEEGHWFAAILSILLWASLVYTAYSLIQKLRNTPQP